MALSRNERRKLRKQRIAEQAERRLIRMEKLALATRQAEVAATVERNMRAPKSREVACNPLTGRRELQGTIGGLAGRMHGATEAVKDAGPYRRMALQRWINSPVKSSKS